MFLPEKELSLDPCTSAFSSQIVLRIRRSLSYVQSELSLAYAYIAQMEGFQAKICRVGRRARIPRGWGNLCTFCTKHHEQANGTIRHMFMFLCSISISFISRLSCIKPKEERATSTGPDSHSVRMTLFVLGTVAWFQLECWQRSRHSGIIRRGPIRPY